MTTPKLEPRAARLDIVIEQGATFRLPCTWKDENGTPVDLSLYTAQMQIREEIASSAALISLSSGTGEIELGAALGTILVTIPATTTATFTWTQGVYDLELTDLTGGVTRLLQGVVIVSPEVTR